MRQILDNITASISNDDGNGNYSNEFMFNGSLYS